MDVAEWRQLFNRCDRAKYLPDEPLDAFDDLHTAAASDPDQARAVMALMPTLTTCRRCLFRWREYLHAALKDL